MRTILPVLLSLLLASPVLAQSADIALVWRGGLADTRDLIAHAQMAPVLERLLGARRAAFDAAMKDPELLAHAKRERMEIDPVDGPTINALLDKAHKAPAEVIARLRALVRQAR